MKKLLVVAVAILLTATWSFADDWVPTTMTLDVEEYLPYDFDGSNLTIPVVVAGKPAAIWLVITTKDKGAEIGEVTNGHMGWHYVNKIDTTVYISAKSNKDIGPAELIWDGTNNDGNDVDPGTYTYYLWAFDDKTAREMACDFVIMGHDWEPIMSKLTSFDKDHLPLPNPVFFGNYSWWDENTIGGRTFRWWLGHDPFDEEGREVSVCSIYTVGTMGYDPGFLSIGYPCLDPDDFDIFYQPCRDNDAALLTMLKWTYVIDGDAILDTDWGGWESDLVFECPEMAVSPGPWARDSGTYSDFNYIYLTGQGGPSDMSWNYIYAITFDGDLQASINHENWYMPDDPSGPGNGWPYYMDWSQNVANKWTIWGNCCIQESLNYTNVLEDEDDTDDMTIWRNLNGDFFFDSGFAPDADPAWTCRDTDSEGGGTQGRHSSLNVDANDFNIWGTGQYGLANFGLSAPDGTGMGYHYFVDETVGDQSIRKGNGTLIDNGGKFDGIYWHRPSNEAGNMWVWGEAMWVGSDSVKGVISNEPAPSVENDVAIGEFSVAQNVPNPFNPTTTISFTISNDDFVTLDIYNVAGQKVDTLVNDLKAAGTHSVVWDSSGLSAGVYFYTLKSGDLSKTMKMTLLK